MTTQHELFLLAVGMVNFLAMLLGLTAFLSIARQLRIRLTRPSAAGPGLPVTASMREDDNLPSLLVVPALHVLDAAPTKPSDAALEQFRAAMRESSSEPLTLSIVPDVGPTRQQRAVQRLIDYLKEESSKATAPVSPA